MTLKEIYEDAERKRAAEEQRLYAFVEQHKSNPFTANLAIQMAMAIAMWGAANLAITLRDDYPSGGE